MVNPSLSAAGFYLAGQVRHPPKPSGSGITAGILSLQHQMKGWGRGGGPRAEHSGGPLAPARDCACVHQEAVAGAQGPAATPRPPAAPKGPAETPTQQGLGYSWLGSREGAAVPGEGFLTRTG